MNNEERFTHTGLDSSPETWIDNVQEPPSIQELIDHIESLLQEAKQEEPVKED